MESNNSQYAMDVDVLRTRRKAVHTQDDMRKKI